MIRMILVLIAFSGLLAGPAMAASATTENCLVTEAAQKAVEREITNIDAAKVNPSSFFSGTSSCISPQLLQSFDLSTFIPDLSGMLTSSIDATLSSVLNAATQQACSVLNSQLSSVISQLNNATTCFNSGLSSTLSSVLGVGSSISLSGSCGNAGKYDLSSSSSVSYGSLFGGGTTTPQTTPVTTTAVPDTSAVVVTGADAAGTADSSSSSSVLSDFGALLFGQ